MNVTIKNVMKVFAGAAVLSMLLVLGVCLKVDSASAAKAKLYTKKFTMGIGWQQTIYDEDDYEIPSGAKIKLKTNKKKVAKVKGSKITAVGIGTAKITVSYKKGKKTKKFGTITVKVKKASVYKDLDWWATTQTGYFEKYPDKLSDYVGDVIEYRNTKAKYTFVSTNESKIKIKSGSQIVSVTGKDGDKVKINVIETYKKKQKKIGTITYTLYDPALDSDTETSVTGVVGRKYSCQPVKFVNHFIYVVTDETDIPDPNELDPSTDGEGEDCVFEGDDDNKTIRFKKAGTFYMYYFAKNYLTDKYETTPFGKVTYTITEGTKTLSDFRVCYEDDEETYELKSKGEFDYNNLFYIRTRVNDYTGGFTVSSSDSEIFDVTDTYYEDYYYPDDYDEIEQGVYSFRLLGHKPGTATLTVSGGGVTKEYEITIKPLTMEPSNEGYFNCLGKYDGKFDEKKLTVAVSDTSKFKASIAESEGYDDGSMWVDTCVEPIEGATGEVTVTVYYAGKEVTHYVINCTEDDDYWDEEDDW
ncbi:MAG: hypothetical protein K5639_03500 [Eubacterium sp.]|nr:hypothetical protein [Eubacterium sp.]